MIRFCGLLCALLAMAACSSSSGKAKAKPFTTHYGDDAAMVAGHILGCAGVAAEAGPAVLPGEVAAADCVIDGHKLVVYTWKDATSAAAPLSSLNTPLTSYSRGTGWSAITVDSASPDAQRAIAAKVAAALGGKVVAGS